MTGRELKEQIERMGIKGSRAITAAVMYMANRPGFVTCPALKKEKIR